MNVHQLSSRMSDIRDGISRKTVEVEALLASASTKGLDAGHKARLDDLHRSIQKDQAELVDTRKSWESAVMNGVRDGTVHMEAGSLGARVPSFAEKVDGRGDMKIGHWLSRSIKAAVTGASGTGAAFTPEEMSREVLDFLAASSVALLSGLRVITTDRDTLKIPHLKADETAAWTSPGGTITPNDPDAETLTATPRKLAALTAIDNEVIADSSPPVLETLGQQLVRAIALKFDLGVFEGSGTAPEIKGLKNVTGIQTVSMGTNGDTIDNKKLDPFADAIGLLGEFNAIATAIVLHPRTWKAILKLKETSTSNKPVIQDEVGGVGAPPVRRIYGVPVFLTSQISITETQGTATNASSAYVYWAQDLVAVMRAATEVELDRSRLFNSDQSELRAVMRGDLVVPNAKAVCRILGIIP